MTLTTPPPDWQRLHLALAQELRRNSAAPGTDATQEALEILDRWLSLDACFLLVQSEDQPDRLKVQSFTANKKTPFRFVEFDEDASFVSKVMKEKIVGWQDLKRRTFSGDALWELVWQAMHLGPYAGPWQVAAAALPSFHPQIIGMVLVIRPSSPEAWSAQLATTLELVAGQLSSAVQLRTTQERLARSMQQSDSALMQALLEGGNAVLMHGVFSPLQTIELQVDLAFRAIRRGDTRDIPRCLETIRGMWIEVNKVVKDFLQMAKSENLPSGSTATAGEHQPPKSEWVNVKSSCSKLEKNFASFAQISGKTLVFRADHGLTFPIREGDFDQIAANLIHNAIKYSNTATRIKVTFHQTHNHSVFDVTSYGIPVLKENAERIFELGFRTPEAIKLHFNAMGWGLYQARTGATANGAELFLAASEPVKDENGKIQHYRNTFRLRARR